MITQLMIHKMQEKKTRNPHLNEREYKNYQRYIKSLANEIQEDIGDSS